MVQLAMVSVPKDSAMARKVMQQGRPPRNCREAFTSEGDHIYTNRYYTPEAEVLIKYLGGDPEAEIRQVQLHIFGV